MCFHGQQIEIAAPLTRTGAFDCFGSIFQDHDGRRIVIERQCGKASQRVGGAIEFFVPNQSCHTPTAHRSAAHQFQRPRCAVQRPHLQTMTMQ